MSFSFGTEVHHPAFPASTNPDPKISYGLRFPEACASHCSPSGSLGVSRCYIVVSSSLSKNTDALDRLKTALGEEVVVGTRVGTSPHTPLAQVIEVINDIRSINIADAEKSEVDCIITLGAGSLTDAAKLVRFGLANDASTEEDMQRLWGNKENNPDFLGADNIRPATAIKLVHIPTSLSGGEYQALAGGTESLPPGVQTQVKGNAKGAGGGNKRTFYCKGVNPELVILDPELCVTTPEWVWLSSGVRAVDHCVETLCSVCDLTDPSSAMEGGKKGGPGLGKTGGDDPLSAARDGLVALIKGLLECKKDPKSLTARRTCQDGVIKAMQAISSGQVQVGASHAIGHQLGPLGVGHGETSCVLLPAVCSFNLSHKDSVTGNTQEKALHVGDEIQKRQDGVKEILLGIGEVQKLLSDQRGLKKQKQTPHKMRLPIPLDDEEDATQGPDDNDDAKPDLGQILYTIIGALGMPQSLEAVNIGEDKFGELAKESLTDIWIKTNPVPVVEEEQVLEILGMCAKNRK